MDDSFTDDDLDHIEEIFRQNGDGTDEPYFGRKSVLSRISESSALNNDSSEKAGFVSINFNNDTFSFAPATPTTTQNRRTVPTPELKSLDSSRSLDHPPPPPIPISEHKRESRVQKFDNKIPPLEKSSPSDSYDKKDKVNKIAISQAKVNKKAYAVHFIMPLLIIGLMSCFLGLSLFKSASNNNYLQFEILSKLFGNEINESQQSYIPLNLELFGTHDMSVSAPHILSSCFKLKGVSVKEYLQMENPEKVDFLTTDSLCDLPNQAINSKEFKTFILLKNPMLQVQEKYRTWIQEEKPLNNSILEYKRTANPMHFNTLTKSILCKSKDEKLSKSDYRKARKFLKEKAMVGLVSSYENAFAMFKKNFHWHTDEGVDADRCVKGLFREYFARSAKDGEFSGSFDEFEKLYEMNVYDINLYSEHVTVGSSKLSNRD